MTADVVIENDDDEAKSKKDRTPKKQGKDESKKK